MSTRQNFYFLLILISGVVWIVNSAQSPGEQRNNQISAPQKGFLAPDFSLETLDGISLTLSELEGQVILLNLWASWCTPCRTEMPALQRVYEEYGSQGFTVLAVNATNQDRASSAAAFSEQLGLTFPILLDTRGTVAQAYRLQALPSSYFIDQTGRIQEIVIGGPMSEALLRSRIQTLLEAKR